MAAIEVSGLSKTYRRGFRRGGQRALDEVNLKVERGIAFGLIGLNGAGKTTFIKTLLGIVHPSAGEVRVLDGSPHDPRVRARIGYLPERLDLPPAWTPRAFLRSVHRLKRLRSPVKEIDEQLTRVGLGADAGRRIGGFSKGMKQRTALAAALLGKPDLLVLDEPTDGVDPLGRIEIRKILAVERERGATIFLNSHLLSETERICDRVAILAGGKLIREGGLDELATKGRRWRAGFDPEQNSLDLSAAGFERGERLGEWIYETADTAELNEALDRARGEGARLISLQRDMRDLEVILAEAVEAQK